MAQTFCLLLDLKDDAQKIEKYITHHQDVWPEVLKSIKASGIVKMEIYHVATRLVMFFEATDDFSFEEKARLDAFNPKVVAWEALMDEYQQRLPFATKNEKWVRANKIFEVS